jgi:predicted RNase H-like nuclease (RuvC/YqgF family)
MGRITFTADEQHQNIIDDVHDEQNLDSQAEAVRQCIEGYAELQQYVTELNDEIDDLETEIDEQKKERRLMLQGLVMQGRDDQIQSAQQIAIEPTAEQRMKRAGLMTRMKWRLFGMEPIDDDDD